MDGLEKILEQIVSEANCDAERVLAEAAVYRQTKLDEAKVEAERIVALATKEAQHATTVSQNRASSIRRTEERKSDLISRQQAVMAVLETAVARFYQRLARSERVSLYAKLIKQSNLPSGVVTLSANETDLGNNLLALLGDSYEISEKVGEFAAGVVITCGDIIENLTVDLVVRQYQTELSALVASDLFATGV